MPLPFPSSQSSLSLIKNTKIIKLAKNVSLFHFSWNKDSWFFKNEILPKKPFLYQVKVNPGRTYK